MANSFDVFDNPVASGARDIATSFGIGANGLLKMTGDLGRLMTGNDNALSQQARKNIESLQKQKSPELLAAEKEREDAYNAETNPFYQTWAFVRKTVTNPLLTAATIAETAPSSIGPGALGAGARMATGKLLARKGAEFATKVGLGTAIGTGAAGQAADIGGDQLDELLKVLGPMDEATARKIKPIADLMDNKGASLPEAKTAAALEIARRTAFGAGAISTASQFLPGAQTIEKAVVGGAERRAAPSILSRVVGAAKGAAGEIGQEVTEEGGGQITKNVLARPVEPEREALAGIAPVVGQAIVGAGALGAIHGAAGGEETSRRKPTPRPVSEEQATAGIPEEPSTSAATKTSVTETPAISLERSEEMTPEQFQASVNVRQALLSGVEPNPEDVRIAGDVPPPKTLVGREQMRSAIDEVQQSIDDWRARNTDAPENIRVVFDPDMLHNGYGIQGAYNPRDGSIFINAAFVNPELAGQIASHEWAHATMASEEGRKAFMEFAQREIPQEELDALAQRYQTNDRLTLLEEWIAENQEKAPGVFARIVSRIREWLSSLGIVNLSDAEVANVMLRTLRQQAENRTQPSTTEQGVAEPAMSLTQQPQLDREQNVSGIMASPSIVDIDYGRAKKNLNSANQARFKSQISDAAPNASVFDAVGDWADGAENSVAAIFEDARPVSELQQLAAKAGLAGDQKAVLWWTTDPEGKDAIHRITWPKNVSMDEARQAMIDAGLENRTLIQTPEGVQGFVFDQGQGNLNKIKTLHENSTEPSINSHPATGDFLGSWTSRTEGKRAYRDVLGRAAETQAGDRGGQLDERAGGEPEKFSLAQTKTPEFKAWFGDSVTVDPETGKPVVYYHGTTKRNRYDYKSKSYKDTGADFNTFQPDAFGLIFGSPSPEFANLFAPARGEESRIYPVWMKAENPFDYENSYHLEDLFGDKRIIQGETQSGLPVDVSRELIEEGDWQSIEQLAPKLREKGYDGLYVREDNAKNLAVFSPEQVKSATGNTGAFGQRPITAEEAAKMGMTEAEAAEAQKGGDIRMSLTGKPVGETALEDAQKLTFKNQTEVSKYLGDVLKKEFPNGLDEQSPEDRQRLAELFDRELSLALTMPENADAIGWYNREMQKVFEVLRSPELDYKLDDPVNRGIFNAILAVTSNGQKVVPQFLKTAELYENWLKTGKIPPVGKWGGERNKAIKGHLTFLNQMIEAVGPEATVNFLTSDRSLGDHLDNLYGMVAEAQNLPAEATVADKKAAVKKYLKTTMPSGELVDYNTVGAAVLGPKLGGGFFANLYGKFDRLTMDRWFMRTFHRLTGRLGEQRTDMIEKLLKEARSEAADVLPEDVSDQEILDEINTTGKQAFKDYKEIKKRLKANPDDTEAQSQDLMRRLYNRYVKAKSGLYDAPDNGGHRKFIREVIDDVQKLRADRGDEKIDTSDVQAILWYLEKDIWNRLRRKADADEVKAIDAQSDEDAGEAEDTAGRVSYSDGARELYRQKTGRDFQFKNEPPKRQVLRRE